jgi:hypothetical protein
LGGRNEFEERSVSEIDHSASDATGRNTTAPAKQDSDNHPNHPDDHQWDGPMTASGYRRIACDDEVGPRNGLIHCRPAGHQRRVRRAGPRFVGRHSISASDRGSPTVEYRYWQEQCGDTGDEHRRGYQHIPFG